MISSLCSLMISEGALRICPPRKIQRKTASRFSGSCRPAGVKLGCCFRSHRRSQIRIAVGDAADAPGAVHRIADAGEDMLAFDAARRGLFADRGTLRKPG